MYAFVHYKCSIHLVILFKAEPNKPSFVISAMLKRTRARLSSINFTGQWYLMYTRNVIVITSAHAYQMTLHPNQSCPLHFTLLVLVSYLIAFHSTNLPSMPLQMDSELSCPSECSNVINFQIKLHNPAHELLKSEYVWVRSRWPFGVDVNCYSQIASVFAISSGHRS